MLKTISTTVSLYLSLSLSACESPPPEVEHDQYEHDHIGVEDGGEHLTCDGFNECVNDCGLTPYSEDAFHSIYKCATGCPPPRLVSPDVYAPWATSCAGVVDEPALCEQGPSLCKLIQSLG